MGEDYFYKKYFFVHYFPIYYSLFFFSFFFYNKCECIKNTYQTSINPLVCEPCPSNFICNKGSIIETLILKPGFWRANKTTLIVEKCKKGYNCVGGMINNTVNDLCNEGHIGPLCDVFTSIKKYIKK